MNYEDIIQIVHTTSDSDVNHYLSLGWRILAVVGQNSDCEQNILYSLGATSKSKKPETKDSTIPKDYKVNFNEI